MEQGDERERPVPQEHRAAVRSVAGRVPYGWGMIPVLVRAGTTAWRTAVLPKDGLYPVPIKARPARRSACGKR